ncbi:replicative DNA helicase [bacterium]|nr:replicative DNA helicase [bacterium]
MEHTRVPSSIDVVAPPHSVEAEKAVLGAILRDPPLLGLITDKIREDHFFLDYHRRIFAVMMELDSKGEPCDLVTVADRLQRMDPDPRVSAPVYLVDLMQQAPVAQNIEHHAKIVAEYYFLRRTIRVCQDTIGKAAAAEGNIMGFIEEIEKTFLEITHEQDRQGGVSTHMEVLESTINELEHKMLNAGQLSGVASGFTDLDSVTGGWQKSDLIILAARPGMGKTAFALNCAVNAVKKGHPTLIFTLEMSKNQLMTRLISAESRVDSSKLRKGDPLTEDERNRLVQGFRSFSGLPAVLGIDETSGISLAELRSRCRRFKKQHGLGMIVIDYLQLMTASAGRRPESREREIAEISAGLKGLAKELQVPVFALAQLNREADKRIDKRPKISDLRESGSIEMDADVILFVYRDEYYDRNSEDAGKAEIIFGKNRHGSLETVPLAYQGSFVSFYNLLKA